MTKEHNIPQYLTIEDVAKRFNVCAGTVRTIINKHKTLPHIRVGRQIRISEEEVIKYEQKNKQGGIEE